MTTASAQDPVPSDAELITASREGSGEAYAELYNRHRAAAYNLARQLARSQAEADDLVSEAFAKLLDTLRSGGGPDSAFRAYLLTALRHCAYDRTRRERKIELSDDVSSHDPGVPFTDTAVAGLDRSLAARAFARLPERWQTVLWHTEIEGQSSAEVAPLLGLTPNGVSALAYRAREGLRQAYLQVHLADAALAGLSGRELERCRAVVDRLGAWTREGLSKRETAQVEQHLDECERCRALAAELADVNGGLQVFVAPLVLGGATAGYLAAAKCGVGTVAVAGVGAGAATGGSASTGAGSSASAGPRQFLTVGGSVTALAAAIAVGLLAGPGEDVKPQAAPPPATAEPPQPPRPPAPPVQPPPAPPVQPPPPAQPPARPVQSPSPPPSPPPPAPGQPSLGVSTPSQSLELEAGGAAVSLPITVRNNGAAQSDPVAVQLNLPRGVTATGGGTATPASTPPQSAGGPASTPPQSAGGPASTVPQSATTLAQGGVSCSGGVGTIRCATAQGLPPGGQAAFVFSLRAAPDAVSGEVTGTISGGSINLRLATVRVVVRPLPDEIDLRASVHMDSPARARLNVQVIDIGRTSGQVTTTIALPDGVYSVTASAGCHGVSGTVTCAARLAPGQLANWQVVLAAGQPVNSGATITAVLGKAQQSRTVRIQLGPPCLWPPGYPPKCPPGHVPHGLIGINLKLNACLVLWQ